LYGHEDNLGWHENTDLADHNYQLDNRVQSYRFFGKHFGLSGTGEEIPVGGEVKTFEELAVGLPKQNLSILELARKLARGVARREVPSRALLKDTVRFQPVEVERAWIAGNTKRKGLETLSYRLEFSNGLSAVATWLNASDSTASAPVVI